jgi:hypothetical protein
MFIIGVLLGFYVAAFIIGIFEWEENKAKFDNLTKRIFFTYALGLIVARALFRKR